MQEAAFVDHLEQALAREPEARLARALVADARTPAADAAFALEHALLDAALEVREVSVADAKLEWWSQEIERALAGKALHPIARALAAATPLDPSVLRAQLAAAAAIAALDAPDDLDALRAPFVAWARAAIGATDEDAACAYGSAVLALRVRRWPAFAQPARARLPLALLARHGLSREDASLAPVRAAPLVATIATTLEPALVLPAALQGAPAARVVVARHVVRAMRAKPVRAAEGRARARPLALVAALWRVGRRDFASRAPHGAGERPRTEERR